MNRITNRSYLFIGVGCLCMGSGVMLSGDRKPDKPVHPTQANQGDKPANPSPDDPKKPVDDGKKPEEKKSSFDERVRAYVRQRMDEWDRQKQEKEAQQGALDEVNQQSGNDSRRVAADFVKRHAAEIGNHAVVLGVGGFLAQKISNRVGLMWDRQFGPKPQKGLAADEVAYTDKNVEKFLKYMKMKDLFSKPGKKTKELRAGVLLEGVSGCGKSTMASRIARELGADLILSSGDAIMSKWVGESGERIRALFESARKRRKPVVIFIDEIHEIGKSNAGVSSDQGGAKATGSAYNALIRQLDAGKDAFDNSNIVFIAATNHQDQLDPELINRLGHKIKIENPDKKERRALLDYYLKRCMHAVSSKDLDFFARATSGSPSRLFKFIPEEAKQIAIYNNKTEIDRASIRDAIIALRSKDKKGLLGQVKNEDSGMWRHIGHVAQLTNVVSGLQNVYRLVDPTYAPIAI